MASADFFWSTVEQIYGEVPNLIKLILQVNGFNSFLALKGIRYEDKQEFFQSLELTVVDLLGSECESPEKSEMEAELTANHQHVNNFRLKPGHRNYIMNLMLEIEKMDVNEFFGRLSNESVATETPMSKPQFAIENVRTTPTKVFVRRSGKQVVLSPSRDADHGYSRDEQEADQDYVFEEEYLTDETMDDIIKLEFDPIEHRQTRKRKSSTAPSSGRRRPEHMYNEEFIAKINNPRRRRVALNKSYPATTEGTRDRFADLIRQVRKFFNILRNISTHFLNISRACSASCPARS